MEKLGIIIVIESGDLEQKSKLLIDSIRTFGGAAKDSKIWAVKPRKGKALKNGTLRFLQEKGVEFIDVNLNNKWYLYGLANKIYASAYVEEHYGSQYETLLFLDSDTIVINSIDVNVLESKYAVAVKPVESKYLTQSKEDKISDFWTMIYEICRLSIKNIWTVKTTINNNEILAYFNSGVIFTKSQNGLFSKWHENFEQMINNKKVYSLPFVEYYLLEQALLTGTILKSISKDQVKLLDKNYNYQLIFQDQIKETEDYKIKILHYHKLLKEKWREDLIMISSEKIDWLDKYLPLKPYKESFMQRYYNALCYFLWRSRRILLVNLKDKN